MGFDVVEYSKKRKEEEKSGIANEGEVGFDVVEYSKIQKVPSILSDFSTRYQSYLGKANELINSYRSRYYDEGGNFTNDTYRSDYADYYESTRQGALSVQEEKHKLLEILDNYGDYFNFGDTSIDDVRASIEGVYTDSRNIFKSSSKDYDHWSQWKNEDEYKAWDAKYKAALEKQEKYAELASSDQASVGRQKYLEDEKKGTSEDEILKWYEKMMLYMGEIQDTTLPGVAETNAVITAKMLDDSYRKPNSDWTEEQWNTFGSLYMDSKKEAFKYAEETNIINNRKKEEDALKKIAESATSNGWAGFGHTLGAIATAPLGLFDFLDDATTVLAGRPITPDGTVSPFEYSQAVTGGISEHLNEESGTLNDDIPIIGGKGWGDVYGLGTSIAQSMASAYTLGGVGTLVSYFGQGAAAGVDEALARGASDEQAVLYGTSLGVFEGLAEMVGIDNLFKLGSSTTVKGFIKNILKQAGAEGAEEGLTALLSTVADNIIMQDKSNFNLAVEKYMAAGMSEKEAKKKAWMDSVEGIAFDTIAGAISGGVSGSVHTTAANIASNIEAKQVYGDGSGVVAEAKELGGDAGVLAEQYQKKLDKGKSLSGGQINRLVETSEKTIKGQDTSKISDAVEARLTKLGETGDVSAITSAIVKQAVGEKLSLSEKSLLKNSKYGQRVANEVSPENIESGEYSSEWAESIGTKRINAEAYNKTAIDAFKKTVAEAKSEAVSEKVAEIVEKSGLVASDDGGETINTKTGEAIAIKEIASIKDGEITLRTVDGDTISAKDVSFSDNDVILYSTVADMGVSAAVANSIIDNFVPSSNVTAEQYALGVQEAYKYGRYGIPVMEMSLDGFSADLSVAQKSLAYRLGASDAKHIAKAAQTKITDAIEKRKQSGVEKAESKGKLRFAEGEQKALEGLSSDQKAVVDFIRDFAVATPSGMKLIGYDKRANGYTNLTTGEMVFSLESNASRDPVAAVLFTAGHESGHYIKLHNPEGFKRLGEFLAKEYGKKGESVHTRVLDMQKKSKNKLTYDEAHEEWVCQSLQRMFASVIGNKDSGVLQRLQQYDNKVAQLLYKALSKLASKISSLLEKLTPGTFEEQFVAEMDATVRKLFEAMYAEELVTAIDNAQWLSGVDVMNDILGNKSIEVGKTSVQEMNRKQTRFQEKTEYEAQPKEIISVGTEAKKPKANRKTLGGRNKVTIAGKTFKGDVSVKELRDARFVENGFSQEEIDKHNEFIQHMADMMKEARVKYRFIGLDDIYNAKILISPTSGEIVLSALVNNGDYPINFDFTKICKKRVALQQIVDQLSREKGKKNSDGTVTEVNLSPENIKAINDILADEGIETACLCCFVESKRYNIQSLVQENVIDVWNSIVDEFDSNAGYFNFADESVNESKIPDKEFDALYEQVVAWRKQKGKSSIPKDKMYQFLETTTAARKKLRFSDIVTEKGRTNLHKLYPDIESLIGITLGTAAPKSVEAFAPYNGEIDLMESTGETGMSEYLFSIAGARSQSFSDFMIAHIFDVVQKTASLSARKFPAHVYTKEIARARLFGMTGEKHNMSVLFNIDPEVDSWNAGLKEDGSYFLSDYKAYSKKESQYIQSIGWDDAVNLQNTEGYSKDCGIIAVGFSYNNMIKIHNDPDVRQVIGYHTSSLPAVVKPLTHLDKATDYTPVQNTLTFVGFVKPMYAIPEGVPSYATPPQDVKPTKGTAKTQKVNDTFDIKATFEKLANGKKGEARTQAAKETLRQLLEYAESNGLALATQKAEAGHGEFDLYSDVDKTKNPYMSADHYIEYCIERGYLPAFFEFAMNQNYYKDIFDWNPFDRLSYNPETGLHEDSDGRQAYAPQTAVHMLNEDGSYAFPSDFFEIVDKQMKNYDEYSQMVEAKMPDVMKKITSIDGMGSNLKFQLRNTIEETKDLVAFHNITPELLADAIGRNGLLMPSLAITNKGMTDFGEISLLFDKSTIDPNANSENKLYGADAWTPTQTTLKKNAKFDTDKTVRTVNNLKNRIGTKYVSELLPESPKQFKNAIIKADGSIYDAYAHNIGMQTAYAMERGIISKIPTKKNGAVDRSALQEQLNKELDTDNGWRQYKKWLNNISDTVITSYDAANNEDIINNMKSQPSTAKTFKLSESGELVVPAAEYGTIDEARKNKSRLSENDEAETKAVASEFLSLAKEIGKTTKASTKTVVDAINATFANRYSTSDIIKSFNRHGIKLPNEVASEIQALYKKAVELPTRYFEAKPQRTVGLDEIKVAVVPKQSSYDGDISKVMAELENLGIEVVEYEAGSDKSRIEAINSVESLKFQEKDGHTDIQDDALYPTSARERSAFNRSMANKTSHLKNKEIANIMIYTADNAYFISANGYMSGKILHKEKIDGNEDLINTLRKEFQDGTLTTSEGLDSLIQGIRNDRGRGYRRHASLKEILAAEGYEDLDTESHSSNSRRGDSGSNKTSKGKVKYQEKDLAPTFYSQMGKVVEGVKQEKFAANSVVNMLRGKGVKAEEIRWSGIVPFLEGKKSVTKQELLDFINGSMLQIGEQVSSNDIDLQYDTNKHAYVHYDANGNVIDTYTYNEFIGGYVSEASDEIYSNPYELQDALREEYGKMSSPRWAEYKLDGGENYREIVFTMPNSTYSNRAMRGHWGDDAEGVLVHARIQDFDVNGKKMLFVEELQSDWHNEGHSKGYSTKEYEDAVESQDKLYNEYKKLDLAFHKYVRSNEFMTDPEDVRKKKHDWLRGKAETAQKKYLDAEKAVASLKENGAGDTHDAPFKDTYHEYVMKRLLRMAAEEGYDSIGWTPADIQSQRWSEDYAEGYRIEYDQDIPKFLRKYGRQWGAKVGSTVLNNGTEVWSMDITDSMKNSVLHEGQVMYQERSDEDISNRGLLANALESAATSGEEKNLLRNYKTNIRLIEAEQKKLSEIKDKLFAKGSKIEPAERKKLQFDMKQASSRISSYDRQLLKLEAMQPIQKVLAREKEMAKKRQKQKDMQLLADYKEKSKATVRELLERNQESRKKAIEGRNMTLMRHKIKGVVNDLNQLLLKGSKERNVKLGLQPAVASALKAINMDTVAADVRVAKYDALIAKAKDPDVIESLTATRDRIQNQGDVMKEKLEALRDAYTEIEDKGNEIPEYYRAETDIIKKRIESVIQTVGNTPLRNMSLAQLESVYELYSMVLATVRNANKVFVQGKLEDLQHNASATMEELSEVKKRSEERLNSSWADSFSWNEMIPVYAFKRMGSQTLEKFFWEAIRGQNTVARDLEEANDFASETRKKYGYKKWDFNKVYEFKLKDGRTFRATLKHLMSIYAYSKRDQALDHMSRGGFFFNDKETFRKVGGVLEIKKKNEVGYCVDSETLDAIKEALTDNQKLYVNEMQEYLTKMGDKGNEVSRAVWGIDIFKEKVYFPLKSVKDFIFQANQTAQESSLKNDGMTKETKPHASNPIVLEAFDDVWANHVNRMSQYHGLVIPIDNLNKIHNYGTWADSDSMSVSTMLGARFGEAVNDYLNQFIKDMNGASSTSGATNPFFGFVGKFKKTAVAASTSVVVQQPTAILRASAVMDGKYFISIPKAPRLATKWNELKKYAPIATIKDIGGFEMGSGRQATEWLNSDTRQGLDKFMGKVDDITMYGAALGDQIGWCAIWEAVKREIKATTNLKEGSQEFFEKAGERFTEVIVLTQVYDSTLSRSGYMRSKHDSVKMLTSFMGEPTVSFNMMHDAVLQAKRGTTSVLKAGRTISATYASIIAASVFASAIYGLRDDDEDESYLEKFAEAFGGKLLGDINPLNMLPAVRDLISILDGWDVERTDVAVFKDLKDAFDGLDSDSKSAWRKTEDLAGAFASVFGLPLKNVLRTTREIWNAVENIFDDVLPKDVGEAFVRGITGEEKEKGDELYDALVSGDKARLEVYRKDYKTEESYETAVRKALRENDPRIKEAAKELFNGNNSGYGKYVSTIASEGNFEEELVEAAIRAEKSYFEGKIKKAYEADKDGDKEAYKKIVRELRDSYRGIYSQDEIVNLIKNYVPDEDDSSDDEEATSIYKASDINVALENGNTSDALEVIDDLVKVKTENYIAEGKSKKEAEKSAKSSVRSSVTSYWKKLYLEAYQSKNNAEMTRIRKILKSTKLYDNVVETCQDWVKQSKKSK